MREVSTTDSLELAQDSYSQYGKEVAMGRAYPCVYDGMKLVYKRAIYSMVKNSPRRKVKVTLFRYRLDLPYKLIDPTQK